MAMSESDATSPQPSDASPPELWGSTPDTPRHRSLLGGVFESVRQVGRDVVSVTLGRLLGPPGDLPVPPSASHKADPQAASDASAQRVGMLHSVAEQLRGAADSYVAAKLDEIEARVDGKLDHIEARIDRKIVELHEQLAEMRDRELRHRLRLLKITLIFTVLVAALSLVYKWVVAYWPS